MRNFPLALGLRSGQRCAKGEYRNIYEESFIDGCRGCVVDCLWTEERPDFDASGFDKFDNDDE
jgi:hypothetical protein